MTCREGAVIALLSLGLPLHATPNGKAGFDSIVAPFFKANCVKCHGQKKAKGKVTLHDLDGNLAGEKNLERWELILDVLQAGEMPPEEEAVRPTKQEVAVVLDWIDTELRSVVAKVRNNPVAAQARRLTNFEYENTIRDLIGFRLNLTDNLPKDPDKPYHFNNTAEFMLVGPEQVDRYLENARKVMASAIVDPIKPEVHKVRREWQPYGLDRGIGRDEVGVWGNRRHSPAHGMGLKSFPDTGEFVIRVQASAILPPGVKGAPLRLIFGQTIQINSSTQRVEPVGGAYVVNGIDEPKVYEFRGRIENFPLERGRVIRGKQQPDSRVITPQVLYDDGTLNDGNRNLTMPRIVINWMEFEAPVADVWPPAHHTRILFESPLREENPEAYVREVITRFVSRAFRRPASDTEVQRFEQIYRLVLPELKTLEAAMRETLAMVLISPQFLYHTVADGEVTKRSYELASRLSYFLWGSMPDAKLLKLAGEGRLTEPKVMEQEVRRMLTDERSKDFVRNFTMQWLSLAKMKTVPINSQLFPRFLYYVSAGERRGTEKPYRPTIRDYMLEETTGFVAELIRRNAGAANLVDSNFAWLNQPLAAHYGVPGVEGNAFRAVSLKPGHQLGGLLTHGSMLIGNGTGSAPHPIYRAVWLREAILGDEVKPPPADVPALTDTVGESAEKALTIKDLLAKHRQQESCNDCHARLDPWGIPFERYNAIGRYQPLVPKEGARVNGFNLQAHGDLAGYAAYLKAINTEKVEASARVPNGPEVDGMPELKEYLLKHRKHDVAENILRRLLTYGIGRELTLHDHFSVDELLANCATHDYRLLDMIITICQSNVFKGMADK
jgi:hypothetical protein